MSVTKQAQYTNLDGFHVSSDELRKFLETDFSKGDEDDLRVEIELEPETEPEEIFLDSHPEVHGDIEVLAPTAEEMEHEKSEHKDSDHDDEDELHVELPFVPGAEDQTDIEEPQEEEEVLEVEDESPWKWTLPNFATWAKQKLNDVPKHSGKSIMGVKRAVAYLERFIKECEKASRLDIDGVLDIEFIEKMKDEAYHGIDRLKEREDKLNSVKHPKKKKKKADEESGMVKNAYLGNITVQVPLLLSSLARTIMDSSLHHGKSAEDLFRYSVKEYDLTKREQTELLQLLHDWGMTVHTDIILPRDSEELDPRSEHNLNWVPQYQN